MLFTFFHSSKGKVALAILLVLVVVCVVGTIFILYGQLFSFSKPNSLSPSPSPAVSPMDTPSPSPLETSDSTPLPTPEATSTPDTPEATSTPDTRPIVNVDLVTAISSGFLTVKFNNINGFAFWVNVTLNTDKLLNVTVLPGTVLEPPSSDFPEMVTISPQSFMMDPAQSNIWINRYEDTNYISMWFSSVPDWQVYTVNTTPTIIPSNSSQGYNWQTNYGDLVKLVSLPDIMQQDVQTFAIWTITQNPSTPNSYRGIGYIDMTGSHFSGPSSSEIDNIRSLFQRAGIQTDHYTILK